MTPAAPNAGNWRDFPLPQGVARWREYSPARCGEDGEMPVVLTGVAADGSTVEYAWDGSGLVTLSELRARPYSAAVATRIGAVVSYGMRTVPQWDWARLDSDVYRRSVAEPLQRAAARWEPKHGSLVLLGPTGVGKTASAVALVHRLAFLAREASGVSDPQVRLIRGLYWCSAVELSSARRWHPLGHGECPEFRAARDASFLVLDELGFERSDERDPWLLELVDCRYRAGAPTLVTSGRPRAELDARYGGACIRRLTERGRGSTVEAGV